MTSTTSTLRRAGAAAIGLVGIIHLVLAPEYLQEEAYIGVLFIVGGIAALAVAARLWVRHDVAAWMVGALIALGMGIGFVLSRTTGLPGFHEEEWEPSGILSLVAEAAYVFIAARAVPALTTAGAASRGS